MTPVFAPRGMVACPHALASAAGVDALRSGGSAVDAAIAAASALAVLYPHMCGIGGDAFWLIYDARREQGVLPGRRRPRGGQPRRSSASPARPRSRSAASRRRR